MVKLTTPVCDFGAKAIEFSLPDCADYLNGDKKKKYNLEQCRGDKGLLVMFICNHCPYVQSIQQDLIKAVKNIKQHGINTVAIMSNNWEVYPDDSPENLLQQKITYHFDFPYLIDKTQEIAKKYGAVCTPDFFGYNNKLELQYRGRFDQRGREKAKLGANSNGASDLEQAMLLIANTGSGPIDQMPSVGCSIKWLN
jgi:peroxiredoxin